MSESSIEVGGGQLQDFTIDQFAGATALVLGSFGGLLMIIWKSRCACRMRLGFSDSCYIFDCERKPPTEPDSDDEGKDNKKDKDKDKKKNRLIASKGKKKKEVVEEVEEEVEEEALVPQNDDDIP